MATNLVIVESPAKAKTIKKYLGSNYKVVASMGHIRDLPKSQLGVDVENGFDPKYITIRGKGDLLSKLKKDAKTSSKVFLATDPDREGEAISWHLAQLLEIDPEEKCRIAFNEITKNAVKSAVKSPRVIDIDLVNAQQTRRILDRVVGYKISPLFWKNVKKGLSAGRVQSVATRLVCDREDEINAFVPSEYWSINADLLKGKSAVPARFHGGANGKKMNVSNEKTAMEIKDALETAEFVVKTVKKSVKKKASLPPFITSTLQQEASKKFGYTSKKTMAAAQQLYEGVDVEGVGLVGLITYMRTDSLRVSDDALAAVREYINTKFGSDYLPKAPRVFKTKKSAQDAHEAIRPSDVSITPDMIKKSVPADQYKLYKLIWERFVASQMESAVYDTISADISADNYILKTTGAKLKFPGFTVLYNEVVEIPDNDDIENIKNLPDLNEGEVLKKKSVEAKQHFTTPPQRYSEAALIKEMEENGIGRPSTYAPTITTILQRLYVEREAKFLKPTALGEITTALMKDHFSDIVDVEFTANMEKQFDDIEEGNAQWNDVLSDFYKGFSTELQSAEKAMEGERLTVPDEETKELYPYGCAKLRMTEIPLVK